MSEQSLNVRISLRNDTATNWTTKNPILKNGELGIESDTNLIKIGNGTSTWTSLSYINIVTSIAWSGVTGKPDTYPPADHNHDTLYPSLTGTRATGTWGISITGNAATSTKLQTTRTISLSGKITGTATSFDGSANISIPVTAVIADSCTGNAATATKATSDASGNIIADTYATKTELAAKLKELEDTLIMLDL